MDLTYLRTSMPRKRSKFSILSGKITRSYEKKGFSKKQASYIGHATAGRIARRRRRRG